MNTEPKKTEPTTRESVREAVRTMPRRLWVILRHNIGWKILALVLALCLWAGLIMQDPTMTRERTFNDVDVSVSGADTLRRNGLIVLNGLEEESLSVRLRVDVPQHEYTTVTASTYNPRIDLSRITSTGEQTLRILTTSTSTYGAVRSVSPESVTVVVDEYVTNYRVPVSVNVIGEYPAGFYGSTPSVEQSTVTVSGPESIVDTIARVCVDFDASTLAAQAGLVRTALPMRFVDNTGNDVDTDLLDVTSAGVLLRTLVVEQQLYPTAVLTVSTAAATTGEPAEGYQLKSITASPATIVGAGEANKLSALDSLFVERAVDLTGVTESFSVSVDLRRPSELIYMSTDEVTLMFEIVPVNISRTFTGLRLSTQGLRDGFTATLSDSRVDVTITGPYSIVNALSASELTAYVKADGLDAGEHELPVLLGREGGSIDGLTYEMSQSTVTATLTAE